MCGKNGSDNSESLQDLVEAIVALREMIDERLRPVSEVMTSKEAAEYLKVSNRQMQRLSVEKGIIGYSQLNGDGSAVRFLKVDLDSYLVDCRVPTVDEVG